MMVAYHTILYSRYSKNDSAPFTCLSSINVIPSMLNNLPQNQWFEKGDSKKNQYHIKCLTSHAWSFISESDCHFRII